MDMFNFKDKKVYFRDKFVEFDEANLSIASSPILYGLSVYTVFSVNKTPEGIAAFRLKDHFNRLLESSKIIGIDTFEKDWTLEKFTDVTKQLLEQNNVTSDVFVRATVHVDALLPGTKSRGLPVALSMFVYPAQSIMPKTGSRLKTSVWRRIPDMAIPARAKVNGAYVNSVLAKQDAIDSGYDDCIFLDIDGHVCELSAANIFLVKNNQVITPDTTSDLLEGINRKTVIELAEKEGYKVKERTVDLTELYVADEVFVCGTSAFIASVKEIDARQIGSGAMGPVTQKIADMHYKLLHGEHELSKDFITQC